MAGKATRWGDLMVEGDARRQAIRRRHGNGLDTVEVDHGGRRLVLTFLERAPSDVHPGNVRVDGPRQAAPVTVTEVRRATEDDPQLEERLLVELSHPGGIGAYTLRLVEETAAGHPGWAPLRGLDPRFAQVGFTFDVDLPNLVTAAPPTPAGATDDRQASYLARDYEGLRQLILDRLAETMPPWSETHVADIGITLVELFAYIGDDLSYFQDAVATEGYLQTARQRISVRRHARLVDYRLGEGCQARAWVCLRVSAAAEVPLPGLVFAAMPGLAPGAPPLVTSDAFFPGAANPARPYTPVTATFERGTATTRSRSKHASPTVAVRPAHNEIALWTWGEHDSWLRAGATTAVLVDGWSDPDDHGRFGPRSLGLAAGDVVVFQATVDPSGVGPPGPTQRHPVRLTAVHAAVDHLYDQPILEVTWADADALPFDLQVSAVGPAGQPVPCAVVRGNTVLVGDGREVSEQLPPGQVVLTQPQLTWACPYPDPAAVARHQATVLRQLPGRWRREVEAWRRHVDAGEPLDRDRVGQLRRLLGEDVVTELGLGSGRVYEESEGLRQLLLSADLLLAYRARRLRVLAALARARGPLEDTLVHEVADDWGAALAGSLSPHHPAAWGPAGAATRADVNQALPRLTLVDGTGTWTVVPDLVGSQAGSRQVMVEMDNAGRGHLRFSPGDAPAGAVQATYQVGQGLAGNVPAEAINAIVWTGASPPAALSVVLGLGNGLAASGGTDPEGIAAAKVAIPGAFLLDQPRAIVAADYTELAQKVAGVRAAATVLRWTGSGYAASVAVQPAMGEDPDEELLAAVDEALRPCRRIGHQLWVGPPSYRPLALGLTVDIGADVVRSEVMAALNALLGSGWQADGSPGLFHPSQLSFGQNLYTSAVTAAVHDVVGVEAVLLTRFGFLAPSGAIAPAVLNPLRLGPREIARLDNDPAAPEHGYAVISLRGGR